jgi:hypothetical protein
MQISPFGEIDEIHAAYLNHCRKSLVAASQFNSLSPQIADQIAIMNYVLREKFIAGFAFNHVSQQFKVISAEINTLRLPIDANNHDAQNFFSDYFRTVAALLDAKAKRAEALFTSKKDYQSFTEQWLRRAVIPSRRRAREFVRSHKHTR